MPIFAKQSIDVTQNYLYLLREGDAGALSAWLSIDGGPEYFREEAEALIAYYSQYDLRVFQVALAGYDPASDQFVVRVADWNGALFDIALVYDGIFILPDFRAVR